MTNTVIRYPLNHLPYFLLSIIFSSLSVPLLSLICFQMSPIQQPSPLPSPLSLPTVPLLTSTLLELDKVSLPSPSQSPFPGDTDNHGCRYGFSKISSVSQVSLSMSSTKSSVVSVGVKDSPTAVSSIKAEVGFKHTCDVLWSTDCNGWMDTSTERALMSNCVIFK